MASITTAVDRRAGKPQAKQVGTLKDIFTDLEFPGVRVSLDQPPAWQNVAVVVVTTSHSLPGKRNPIRLADP